jgi:hypothetical protein
MKLKKGNNFTKLNFRNNHNPTPFFIAYILQIYRAKFLIIKNFNRISRFKC